MERRVEAAGEGLPKWQKRDISAVSGSEDRDLSERRTDPVRWGDELNVEAVSGSQGINTPSLLSSLLQVSNASHGTNTARYSQGARVTWAVFFSHRAWGGGWRENQEGPVRTSGLGLLVRNPEVSGWGNVPHSGLVCDVRQMEKSGES